MDSIKWIFLRVVCYPYGVPDLVQRWDYVELPRPRKDANNFLVAPQTRIARTGPQTYQNADGSTHIELRLPEDVGDREALASLSGLPITVGHPGQVTPSNVQSHAVGSTGRADLRGDLVEADVSIWAERGQRAAEDGARELSVGYQTALEPVPGGVFRRSGHPYDGTRADFLQRGIRGNHLALVDRGRANQGRPDRPVGLRLDADGNQEQPGVEAQEDSMDEEITINGQTFKVPKAAAAAFRAELHAKADQQRGQVRADADDGKLAALQAEKAKADARADAAEAALKAEQDKAKSEETLAERRKADAERLALVVEVAKVTNEDAKDLLELDPEALYTKALEKLSPDLKLDGKGLVYKQALYDHLSTQAPAQGSSGQPKRDSATEIQQALAGGQARESKADESPLVSAVNDAHKGFFFSGHKAKAQ